MQRAADSHPTRSAGTGAGGYAHSLAHDQRRARKPYTDRKFTRSRKARVLGGVCGGIAAFIGTSATNVRLVYALSVLLSVGTTAVGYLLLWLLIPAEPTPSA